MNAQRHRPDPAPYMEQTTINSGRGSLRIKWRSRLRGGTWDVLRALVLGAEMVRGDSSFMEQISIADLRISQSANVLIHAC